MALVVKATAASSRSAFLKGVQEKKILNKICTKCVHFLLHFSPSLAGTSLLSQALARSSPRRPRGEKKPIPDEQKDDKYFERRKRNNLAAKKSRDQVKHLKIAKDF